MGLTLIVSNTAGAHQERVTFSAQNLGKYTGTVTGGPPSVSNPQTLSPSGFGVGSAFTVTAP